MDSATSSTHTHLFEHSSLNHYTPQQTQQMLPSRPRRCIQRMSRSKALSWPFCRMVSSLIAGAGNEGVAYAWRQTRHWTDEEIAYLYITSVRRWILDANANPGYIAVRKICRDFASEKQSHRSPINQEVQQKALMEEQAEFMTTPLLREIRLAREHLRKCDPDAQSHEVLAFAFRVSANASAPTNSLGKAANRLDRHGWERIARPSDR